MNIGKGFSVAKMILFVYSCQKIRGSFFSINQSFHEDDLIPGIIIFVTRRLSVN